MATKRPVIYQEIDVEAVIGKVFTEKIAPELQKAILGAVDSAPDKYKSTLQITPDLKFSQRDVEAEIGKLFSDFEKSARDEVKRSNPINKALEQNFSKDFFSSKTRVKQQFKQRLKAFADSLGLDEKDPNGPVERLRKAFADGGQEGLKKTISTLKSQTTRQLNKAFSESAPFKQVETEVRQLFSALTKISNLQSKLSTSSRKVIEDIKKGKVTDSLGINKQEIENVRQYSRALKDYSAEVNQIYRGLGAKFAGKADEAAAIGEDGKPRDVPAGAPLPIAPALGTKLDDLKEEAALIDKVTSARQRLRAEEKLSKPGDTAEAALRRARDRVTKLDPKDLSGYSSVVSKLNTQIAAATNSLSDLSVKAQESGESGQKAAAQYARLEKTLEELVKERDKAQRRKTQLSEAKTAEQTEKARQKELDGYKRVAEAAENLAKKEKSRNTQFQKSAKATSEAVDRQIRLTERAQAAWQAYLTVGSRSVNPAVAAQTEALGTSRVTQLQNEQADLRDRKKAVDALATAEENLRKARAASADNKTAEKNTKTNLKLINDEIAAVNKLLNTYAHYKGQLPNRQQQIQGLKAYRDQLNGAAEAMKAHIQQTDRAAESTSFLAKRQRDLAQAFRSFIRYAVEYRIFYEILLGVRSLASGVSELEDSLVSIQAITGTLDTDLNKIERSILRVATTTKFSTRDISQAALTLSQAGVEPGQLDSAIEASANLAAATNSSLSTTADLISTIRNVFKDLSDPQIADQLRNAVNISKLTADDLKTILSRGLQTANAFNISSQEYLSAVTILRNAGIKASTVSTGLRQGILELLSPDAKTIRVLQSRYRDVFGKILSSKEIRDRFFQITQGADPLRGVLTELKTLGAGKGGSAELQFRRVFDVRAENVINALLANIGQLAGNQTSISATGTAAEGAQTRLESFNASLDNLGASLTAMTYQLSNSILPPLTRFVQLLTDGAKGIRELAIDHQSQGSSLGSTGVFSVLAGLAAASTSKASFLGRTAIASLTGVGVFGGATALQKNLLGSDSESLKAANIGFQLASAYTLLTLIKTVFGGFGKLLKPLQAAARFAAPVGGVFAGIGTFFSGILKIPGFKLLAGLASRLSGIGLAITGAVAAYQFLGDDLAEYKDILEGQKAKQDEAKAKLEEVKDSFEKYDPNVEDSQAQLLQNVNFDTIRQKVGELLGTDQQLTDEAVAFVREIGRIGLDIQSPAFQSLKQKLEEATGIEISDDKLSELTEFAAQLNADSEKVLALHRDILHRIAQAYEKAENDRASLSEEQAKIIKAAEALRNSGIFKIGATIEEVAQSALEFYGYMEGLGRSAIRAYQDGASETTGLAVDAQAQVLKEAFEGNPVRGRALVAQIASDPKNSPYLEQISEALKSDLAESGAAARQDPLSVLVDSVTGASASLDALRLAIREVDDQLQGMATASDLAVKNLFEQTYDRAENVLATQSLPPELEARLRAIFENGLQVETDRDGVPQLSPALRDLFDDVDAQVARNQALFEAALEEALAKGETARTLDPDIVAAKESLQLAIEDAKQKGQYKEAERLLTQMQSLLTGPLRDSVEGFREALQLELTRSLQRFRGFKGDAEATAGINIGEVVKTPEFKDLIESSEDVRKIYTNFVNAKTNLLKHLRTTTREIDSAQLKGEVKEVKSEIAIAKERIKELQKDISIAILQGDISRINELYSTLRQVEERRAELSLEAEALTNENKELIEKERDTRLETVRLETERNRHLAVINAIERTFAEQNARATPLGLTAERAAGLTPSRSFEAQEVNARVTALEQKLSALRAEQANASDLGNFKDVEKRILETERELIELQQKQANLGTSFSEAFVEGLSSERLQSSLNKIAGDIESFANEVSDTLAQIPYDLVDGIVDAAVEGRDILQVMLDLLADAGKEVLKLSLKGTLNDLFTSPADNVPEVNRSFGGIAANPLLGGVAPALVGGAVPVYVTNQADTSLLPGGKNFVGPLQPSANSPVVPQSNAVADTETQVKGLGAAAEETGEQLSQTKGFWDDLSDSVSGWWDNLKSVFSSSAQEAQTTSSQVQAAGGGISSYLGGVLAIVAAGATIAQIILNYQKSKDAYDQAMKEYELRRKLAEERVEIRPEGPVYGYIRDGAVLGKFSEGGILHGPGTSTSDSITAYLRGSDGKIDGRLMLSRGEAVLNAKAVKSIGEENIHILNQLALKGKFKQGGIVGKGVPGSKSMEDTLLQVKGGGGDSETPITVALFDDRRQLEDFLASSKGGRIIVQQIERNASQTNQVLT